MRIWILSDLHIEQSRWDFSNPAPDHDVLIAAGDIHDPLSAGVRWLAERAGEIGRASCRERVLMPV